MGQEPGLGRTSVELDRLLLEAKLSVPWQRTATVSRAGLISTARASSRRVVGVTAPAGYGKSSLLAEWVALEDRPVAWVTLDKFDDHPLNLLTVIASAFATVESRRAGLMADMVGPDASVLGRAAPRLAAALRASSTPFLLVLDDLHEVRSPACHDALSLVISGVPAGSQLVVASRAEQPHLAPLRATGEILEITAEDLAFGTADTEQAFAASDVSVSHEVAAEVTRRTEGWPVAIYLTCLIARHDARRAGAITGDDPYVADYLQREVFRQLPEETRRFLRRTAVLDDLSAPLCDSIMGEHTSQLQLRELEASSLFLVPLDRRREWFRYHALFREFLLADLMSVEPELADALRVRAADWFEEHGSPARAVEYLLATPERRRCVPLVTRIVLSLFQTGKIATIERWLRALGDRAVASYPPLAVLAGYVAVYEGRAVDAEHWGAVADEASFNGELIDGSASFDSLRAMFHAMRCPDGPRQMVDDTRLALESEPEWSSWRDTALSLSGAAHLLVGDVESATQHLERALEAAGALGNADTLVFSEAQLAHLDMDRGRWDRARERVQRALASVEERRMDDYPTSALGFAAAARLSQHLGDLVETRRQLARGMRARASCTYAMPTLAVRVRLHLARTSWATGDTAAVRHLLREIDDVLLHRPRLGVLLDEVAELRKALDTSAHTAGPGSSISPLTPAELRLLPYLQTHLTIREIGERLYVSRNTASSEIGAIYRKLGVSSRSDAVRQAAAMGLLGG
jgi:LuxR family maltose regulon positive regulatory protein